MNIKMLLLKHKKTFTQLAFVILLFVGTLYLARVPATFYNSYFKYKKIIGLALLSNLIALYLNKFSKKIQIYSLGFILLYLFPSYLKLAQNSTLTIDELTDTFCLAVILFSLIITLLGLAQNIPYKGLRIIVFCPIMVLFVLILLDPLILLGYYIASGHLLTTSIILTVFQTNLGEAWAYLQNNNPALWFMIFLGTFVAITALTKYLISICDEINFKQYQPITLVFLVCLLIVSGGKGIARAKNTISYVLYTQTKQSLKEYKAYGEAKDKRMENLQRLGHLSVDKKKGGLYILVIGESEARDHMEVYGYSRATTPWLKQSAKNPEFILFSKAYSNHTHTVPTLTFALTEKNQYNAKSLKNAYSIIEIARAAGYQTYWLSNQVKYGVYDTPVAEIASTADHEIWINDNSGTTTKTSYYDEELINRLTKIPLREYEKNFIVIHLMGSHADYSERYPKQKQRFSTKDKKLQRIDSYDNSVAYTDYVLQQIYDSVKNLPSFKGMVYFSDHGEDMQNSHEATKFTWTMARIPFFVILSDKYGKDNLHIYQTLVKHKDVYWTNDLLYDMLISVMGIQNVPEKEDHMDVSSDTYNMPVEKLTTLHGKKKIADDIAY